MWLLFCFIERSVFLNCLSLPAWLSEGPELGSGAVGLFKTCSTASVMGGDLLGSGCGACACAFLFNITLPFEFPKHSAFSLSHGLLPLNSFLDMFCRKMVMGFWVDFCQNINLTYIWSAES